MSKSRSRSRSRTKKTALAPAKKGGSGNPALKTNNRRHLEGGSGAGDDYLGGEESRSRFLRWLRLHLLGKQKEKHFPALGMNSVQGSVQMTYFRAQITIFRVFVQNL